MRSKNIGKRVHLWTLEPLSKMHITCHELEFIKTNRYQTRTVNIMKPLF